MVPSTYKDYDEGMKAIEEQIRQDFFPQYHNLVMQAFYQQFYAIEVKPGEIGEKVWARWRGNLRRELENPRRSSSVYSTVDIEDMLADPRYFEPSTSQARMVTLAAPDSTSRGIGTARERQERASVLISEEETDLLRNRDSNYWGDLAVQYLPHTTDKAKIVNILPKSSKHTVNIEAQQLSNLNVEAEVLSSHSSNDSLYRYSLPTCISQIDDSSGIGGVTKNISAIETDSDTREKTDTTNALDPFFASRDSENAPLTIQRFYEDSLLETASDSSTSIRDQHNYFEKPFLGDVTPVSVTGTFVRRKQIHPEFIEDEVREYAYNHAERSFPRSSVSETFVRTVKRREERCPKVVGSQYSESSHPSSRKNTEITPKIDSDKLETQWKGYSVRGVDQGYESSVPAPLSSRRTLSSQFHEVSERNYSNGSKDLGNRIRADRTVKNFNQSSLEECSSHSISLSGQNTGFQNSGARFTNIESPPVVRETNGLLWDSKPLPHSHQHQHSPRDQVLGTSALVTCNNNTDNSTFEKREEINEDNRPGIPRKLRSRFSFVLPHKSLGARIAHKTCRRNSLLSNSLKVTKEVLREEEESTTGNASRSTFTAHVPPFGKDPMKEIHRAHTKSEAKKPAFLRAIQDAVQDGISIGRKSSNTPDITPLRTAKSHQRIDKLKISGPMHDGNPLKMSSSPSTPQVLLNATPIPRVLHDVLVPLQNASKPSIVLQILQTAEHEPCGQRKPQTELLPWELDDTPLASDELSVEDDHEDETNVQTTAKIGKTLSKSPDHPAITIGPFQQAALYSWIECSVVQACSDFLRQQQKNLNLDSLKREVKKWKSSHLKLSTGEIKFRDQPVEFMFGMDVQCKLLEGNYKNLHFVGPSAMNAITIINAWKNVIPSFYPRTFCFPDYLILEHLRVIEKVLRLFGPAYWDSTMFEKKRAQIVKLIMEAGQSQKAWSDAEKMTKLQRERERAEASLLQEVGIWSTENSPVAINLDSIKDDGEF